MTKVFQNRPFESARVFAFCHDRSDWLFSVCLHPIELPLCNGPRPSVEVVCPFQAYSENPLRLGRAQVEAVLQSDERHASLLESGYGVREVDQRAAKPIELPHQDGVEPAFFAAFE